MKDSLRRTGLISLLGCVCLMPLLILPVMVGTFVDHLALTESQAGWLAAAGFLGSATGALVMALRIHHLDLRRLAPWGLMAMVVADAASIAASDLPVVALVVLRLISGLGGAAVLASVMSAFAVWREPDRAYGFFMAMQFAVSGAGLYVLPSAMSFIGVPGLFILFTAVDLAAFALVRQLPDRSERAAKVAGAPLEWHVIAARTSLVCLLGIGMFEAANMAQFTYVERIGVAFGLNTDEIGLTLGIATVLGIPAGFGVTWLGTRFGYFKPLAAAMLVAVFALGLLAQVPSHAGYWIACGLLSMCWAFGLPYFHAIEARLDPGGSVVVAGTSATDMAGFVGPAAAAALVAPGRYTDMLMAAAGCFIVAVLLMRFVTLRLKKV